MEGLFTECDRCGSSVPLGHLYCNEDGSYCLNTYSQENEHETFGFSNWKEAVANEETILGYDDWVQHQLDYGHDYV